MKIRLYLLEFSSLRASKNFETDIKTHKQSSDEESEYSKYGCMYEHTYCILTNNVIFEISNFFS
jgi:hypothetical protein